MRTPLVRAPGISISHDAPSEPLPVAVLEQSVAERAAHTQGVVQSGGQSRPYIRESMDASMGLASGGGGFSISVCWYRLVGSIQGYLDLASSSSYTLSA